MPANLLNLPLTLFALSPIVYLLARVIYIRLLEEKDKRKLFQEMLKDNYRCNHSIETNSDPVKTLKYACFCNMRLKTKDRLRDEFQRTSTKLLIVSIIGFSLMLGVQVKVNEYPKRNQNKEVSR